MDRATRPVGDFADDSSPAAETPALYDVERGLAFLRKHTRAADFASGSGSNPRAMDPSAPDSSTGNPRDDARPDFYPVDASVAASATGVRGASRSSAADFARASRRGLDGVDDDRRRGGVDFEFADGDVLYLLPETADDAVYPRRDRRVPDLARDLGRARAEPAPAGETTRDVDYLRERHLARLYPRLDAGSGAVRLDAPRARGGGGMDFFANVTDAGDLDAGVYHDDAANVDARARRSGRTRAPNVDIAASGTSGLAAAGAPKSRHDGAREGDALVLDPGPNPARDKRTPGVSLGRARARWDVPGDVPGEDARALADGDALTLAPGRGPGGGVSRATDFGRAVGRGADPTRAWTEDAVVHARRSERTPKRGEGDAARADEGRSGGVLARGAGKFGTAGVGRAAEARAEARANAPTRRAGDAAPREETRTVVG